MPKGPKGEKRPADVNGNASLVAKFALAGSVVIAVIAPAQADDIGATIVAGIISGTALGIIASTPGFGAGAPAAAVEILLWIGLCAGPRSLRNALLV
jgi:hypothetical protein